MSLEAKWNPLVAQPEDYKEMNEEINKEDPSRPEGDDAVTYVTRIIVKTLADTFCIFCDDTQSAQGPLDTKMEPEPDKDPVEVFTEGSATNNRAEDAEASMESFSAKTT